MTTAQKKEIALLLGLCIACVGIFLFRIYATHLRTFMFLNWNLLLAAVPWLLTRVFIAHKEVKWYVLVPVLGTWLLFFPNAPYILTDLFHLKPRHTSPIWLDLVLILSYAWTGLLFGFYSLKHLEVTLKKYGSTWQITLLIIALLFVSSFGIYLGRYLRWNSWDMLTHPAQLLQELWLHFAFPFQHMETWGMTFFMGLFLNMIYWSWHYPTPRTSASQV